MKKMFKVMAGLALVALAFVAVDASAQIFETASSRLTNLFANVRQIVFILGGFALVGMAFGALFGKIDWKKVAILAVGLGLLAVASQVIEYAATGGDDEGLDYSGALTDIQ